MIEIPEKIYDELARKLKEKIGTGNYVNTMVEQEGVQLVVTAIIYRREEQLPEGRRRPIVNVVPVWWEVRLEGKKPKEVCDLDFEEVKNRIIENY